MRRRIRRGEKTNHKAKTKTKTMIIKREDGRKERRVE